MNKRLWKHFLFPTLSAQVLEKKGENELKSIEDNSSSIPPIELIIVPKETFGTVNKNKKKSNKKKIKK